VLRNLCFLALCGVAIVALAKSLSLGGSKLRPGHLANRTDVHQAIERLNASLAEQWRRHQVEPAAPAEDLIVARRLALGLMGTAPSIEEIRQLEAISSDERIDRYLAAILDDRRCHDYLAERLARAYVGVGDGAVIVYRRGRFVGWLSEQLRDNRPYDAVVREMLAAEGQGTDRPAVNFLLATMRPGEGKLTPQPKELASRVSRVMLGVRIDCAECHDHPFDSWKQKDFHGLAAFFGGAKYSFSGIHDVDGAYQYEDHSTGREETISPRVPFGADGLSAEGPARVRLARWVTDAQNRRFSRATVNRIWALMFGRGLVEPIDDIHDDASLPEPLTLLADDFSAHGYDLRRLIRVIAGSRAFGLDSRLDRPVGETISPAEHELAWAVFPLTRLRPEQIAGCLEQSSSLATYDDRRSLLLRAAKTIETGDFLKRYGDLGENEMDDQGGTVPQRLLMMNGNLVRNKTRSNPLSALLLATTQIALLASSDRQAVDVAYLAVLSRHPSPDEQDHFSARLADTRGRERARRLDDLCWTLMNSTEFSWNH
jgi:hypothetical protein